MKVKVLTDSGGCMSSQEAEQHHIDYLPLQVIIEDKTYLDGVNLTNEVLYDFLEQGAFPQTSLPPLGAIEDLFDQYEKDEVTDIVLITLSNGLSSTNDNVTSAAMRHNIKVHTLDIFSTLAVEGYWARCAAHLVEQGVDPDEIVRRIQESVDHSAGYLIVENLDHLVAGGRLTPMAAKLAGLMKIKPILLVSNATKGKVGQFDKVRTFSKAVKRGCEVIAKSNINDEEYITFIMDARNEKGSHLAHKHLRASFPNMKLVEQPLAAVIASHTGLESVGLQYAKKVEGCQECI